MWGSSPYILRGHKNENAKEPNLTEKSLDPHVRSTHDVRGHHVQAADGGMGHVDDFVIDDEAFAIRYLIIDTKNWWPGQKVLISPLSVRMIEWDDRLVNLGADRPKLQDSPAYDPCMTIHPI